MMPAAAMAKLKASGFRFLDLPPELKLEIYGYYAFVDSMFTLWLLPNTSYMLTSLEEGLLPNDNEADADDAQIAAKNQHIQQVIQTRKSLLLVCRAINQEFTPMFFSTTTIVLKPSPLLTDLPRKFGEVFMPESAQLKLSFVTKLKFKDLLSNGYLEDFRECEGMVSLLGVLQTHLPQFHSLKKITYNGVLGGSFAKHVYEHDKNNTAKIFRALDVWGQLGRLERQALGSTRKGILHTWNSRRKVIFGAKVVGLDMSGQPWVHLFKTKSFKIVFERNDGLPLPTTWQDWVERGRRLGVKK